MQPTLATVERLARQAGQILRAGYTGEYRIDYKGVIDLVTEVDHQSEEFLLGEIRQLYPQHGVLAEESGSSGGSDGHIWYIDPLDGTVNFAHGVPIFAVSIAYACNGQVTLAVVHDPLREETFSAERDRGAWLNGRVLQAAMTTELQRSLLVTGFPYDSWSSPRNNLEYFSQFSRCTQGVRRLGSAALDLCYVAAGRFDGYWELSLKPWDVAAGGLIAEQAGASVTNLDGGPDYLSPPNSILAASPALHPQMLEILRAA
ncbi:MAG: inositol monophosphatase family protein [Chloroflexota bacterium]